MNEWHTFVVKLRRDNTENTRHRVGGPVVRVLALYSNDQSSNPTKVYHFSAKLLE